MKTLLPFLRHALTFLAGLGGLLGTWSLISPAEAPAVAAAGSALIEPLSIIGGALVAGLARLLMGWLGLAKPNLPVAGFLPDSESGQRLPAWLLLAGLAGLAGFSLPACSPGGAPTIPVQACYIDAAGNKICYSTATGITATVDRRSRK